MQLTFPFYPPRPTGGLFTMDVYRSLKKNYLVSPKLNGDRVLSYYNCGRARYANRHGSDYKFAVKTPLEKHVEGVSLFDGEVEKGQFFPFEALIVNGKDLRNECPSVRAAEAKRMCEKAGIPYLFDEPKEEWLAGGRTHLPRWEGVVLKAYGSRYLNLPKASSNTPTWIKLKW